MRTIYKYELPFNDKVTVNMPKGAEVLTVQTQGRGLYLWALVEPSISTVERRFEIFGTGHPITAGKRNYIGTAQVGPYVWHVFENLEE
jgi:hypothetical protein